MLWWHGGQTVVSYGFLSCERCCPSCQSVCISHVYSLATLRPCMSCSEMRWPIVSLYFLLSRSFVSPSYFVCQFFFCATAMMMMTMIGMFYQKTLPFMRWYGLNLQTAINMGPGGCVFHVVWCMLLQLAPLTLCASRWSSTHQNQTAFVKNWHAISSFCSWNRTSYRVDLTACTRQLLSCQHWLSSVSNIP